MVAPVAMKREADFHVNGCARVSDCGSTYHGERYVRLSGSDCGLSVQCEFEDGGVRGCGVMRRCAGSDGLDEEDKGIAMTAVGDGIREVVVQDRR